MTSLLPSRRSIRLRSPKPTRPIIRRVESNDAALVEEVALGREEALAELYERYSPAVWRLACATVGADCAGDVVVAVFVDLWRGPSAMPGESADEAHSPIACRLFDAVVRRSDGSSPLCNLESHERAAFLLVRGGATRETVAAALRQSPSRVAALLGDALRH